MKIRRFLLAALTLGTLLTPSAHAADGDQLAPPEIYEDPNGAFHIDFTTPSVYDLSSDWVSHDEAGRLSGLLRDTDGADFDVQHVISGKIKQSRGVTTVKQRVVMKGVVGGGDEYKAVSNYKGTMFGYGAATKLVGIAQTRACIKFDYAPVSKKKVVVCTNSVDDREWDHDGRWAIRIKFDNVGRDLVGTAIVYVAEFTPGKSKSYETEVSGRLDADGEANFKLKPIDDNGIGGTIKLRALVSPGNAGTPPQLLEILEVGGNILGQKFAEVY